MALPVALLGTLTGPQNSYHGPFKSTGGAFYATLPSSAADNRPSTLKATDPTAEFNHQDFAARPDFVATISSINTFRVDDNLHVAGQNSSDDVYYARFDMSSDTWDEITTGNPEDLIDGTPDGTADACDIAVLSAAYGAGSAFVKIRVPYQGQTDMDMGNPFERIDESNSVDDGVNWSAPTQIDNGVSVPGVDYVGPRIVKHPNDDQCFIICILNQQPAGGLNVRAIAGDDTLRTIRDMSEGTGQFNYLVTHGLGFTRDSTDIIRIGFRSNTTDLEILEFNAFADDTDFSHTTTVVTTDDVQRDNESINACLAADGSVIRGLMVKTADDDLYEFFDDDADSYTLQGTRHGAAGTYNHISCNVYDRSGTKLAMIYDDGGTVKYDEIDVSVAPSGRIMSSLVGAGGLAGPGGIAGAGGGLAG